jgi:hypothetical protein
MHSRLADVALGHPDERIAVIVGVISAGTPPLHHALELARTREAPLDIIHVHEPFDEQERRRLIGLLQHATLAVVGDDSPLLVGTTQEQLALALAETAHCGVVVVPTDSDGTRAA